MTKGEWVLLVVGIILVAVMLRLIWDAAERGEGNLTRCEKTTLFPIQVGKVLILMPRCS